MGKLILIYIAGVLVKWGWEAFNWVGDHRAAGFRGWWDDQKIEVGKKAFMHVFLCPGWISGLLTNVISSSVGTLTMSNETGPAVSIPIIPATTIMAAFMLDSIGKPLMAKLKRREKEEVGP